MQRGISMNINQSDIMKRFSEERRKYGTQEQLADAIGVNPKTISAFEKCRRTPSLPTFIKMCTVIKADINYVVYGSNNNQDF